MLKIRDSGGTLRAVTGVAVRDSGGILRTIKRIQVRDAANVLRIVFDAFSGSAIVASPSAVQGYAYSHSAVLITAGPARVTVTGGSGSYTYEWAADVGGWTALDGFSSGTQFRSPPCAPGTTLNANFVCTVTDTVTGLAADSNPVAVDVSNDWSV